MTWIRSWTGGLGGATDAVVWEGAQLAGRLLVTQDLDFSDRRSFAPPSHHGILILRLREPGRLAFRRRLLALFESEDIESWTGALIIASERHRRIRFPPEQD